MLCIVPIALSDLDRAEAQSRVSDRLLARSLVAPETAAEISEHCEARLSGMLALQRNLEAMPRQTPAIELIRAYDDFYTLFASLVNTDLYLVRETHPDAALRSAAEECIDRSSAAASAATMSRPIYGHLQRIEVARLPSRWRFMLRRQLEIFRRSGVNADAATRGRIAALQEAIAATAAEFQKNLREDVRTVLARPEELAGLPADYVSSHPAGADGLVRITTSSGDLQPVFRYAQSSDLRRRVMVASLSRAYPQNEAVLRRLLQQRAEMASLLGHPSYAAYDLANRMVVTPERAGRFLDDIAAVARPAAERDASRMLARLQRDDPTLQRLHAWDSAFATTLIHKEEYEVDAAEVRRYLAFPKVRAGIVRLAEDLFDVHIRPWQTDVWAPEVTAYEVVENGQVLGRFYLDMHPRPGKNTHASMFPIRMGSRGRALPTAALVMNLPTGLLEHAQLRTFLHEFGHVMHWILSGRVEWSAQNFYELENDVIETPSQMLEEWAYDHQVLGRFATDDAGRAIPRELVDKLNGARRFGDAFSTMNQLGYAAAALDLHSGKVRGANLSALFVRTHGRYAIAELPSEVHPQANFTHLSGYGPSYYSYQWSKALAIDLLSSFRSNGLSHAPTARRYRELILEPGGSQSMNTLARQFLGREWSVEAYRRELLRPSATQDR